MKISLSLISVVRAMIFIGCLIFSFALAAQLPKTELYLFNFSIVEDQVSLRNPVYLSGFNPDGYNNQPAFFNTDELYLTTDKYGDFTEIIKLDLSSNTLYRITETDSISEFSPTLSASDDRFSTVRIEKDGSTQSLWLYPIDQTNGGKRLFEKISTIGYHCWLSDNKIAMFLLPEPFTLFLGDLEKGSYVPIIDNIGRCLRQNEDGDLVFVHKIDAENWLIKSYDVETRSMKIITATIPGSEDYIILPDGTFLMGSGSLLYSFNPMSNTEWQEVDDLSDYNITNITRMAMSRNKLVIVNAPN